MKKHNRNYLSKHREKTRLKNGQLTKIRIIANMFSDRKIYTFHYSRNEYIFIRFFEAKLFSIINNKIIEKKNKKKKLEIWSAIVNRKANIVRLVQIEYHTCFAHFQLNYFNSNTSIPSLQMLYIDLFCCNVVEYFQLNLFNGGVNVWIFIFMTQLSLLFMFIFHTNSPTPKTFFYEQPHRFTNDVNLVLIAKQRQKFSTINMQLCLN